MSVHLTFHHFAHGAHKVRLYNLFCGPRRVKIQRQAGRQAGRAARASSRTVMRRGPTRDVKRPFGVAGIVGIEHQRWRGAQRGWGTTSTGRALRTLFGNVSTQPVRGCVRACAIQPWDLRDWDLKMSQRKTTIKGR